MVFCKISPKINVTTPGKILEKHAPGLVVT